MNTASRTLDHVSIWVLEQITPADLREPLIGDLFEHSKACGRAAWQVALRSMPHMLVHSMSCAFRALSPRDVVVLCSFALALLGWEYWVAREWAWPFAKTLVTFSPFSAAQTCMGAYLILYFGLALICNFALSQARQAHLVSGPLTGFSRLMLFVPGVCFLLLPTAIDHAVFRLLQFVAVLAGLVAASVLRQHTRWLGLQCRKFMGN